MLIYNDITCFVFDVICCGFHVKNFRFLLNAQKSKYKYQARHFFFHGNDFSPHDLFRCGV